MVSPLWCLSYICYGADRWERPQIRSGRGFLSASAANPRRTPGGRPGAHRTISAPGRFPWSGAPRRRYAAVMLRFALVLAAGMAFAQTNDIGVAREAVRTAE